MIDTGYRRPFGGSGEEYTLKRFLCMLLAVLVLMQPVSLVTMAAEDTDPTAEAFAWTEEDPESLPEEIVPDTTEPAQTEPEETLPGETEPAMESEEVPEPEEEVVETGLRHAVPLYYQTDYPDTMYGVGTVANNGCGVTCLAMVASYLTGYDYTPDLLAKYFGGKAENNIDRLEYGSDAMALPYHKAKNWHETLAALQEGKIAIALMGSDSIFTTSQHFIVLTGMTEDGRILVNDPYEPNYDYWLLRNGFARGFTPGDILCGYSGAWIYDPEAMPEEPTYYVEERLEVPCRYPDVELTQEEIQLLARVIWVEARGESARGQQAVAEVILNRLVSGRYGNTLSNVIYGEGQFCSVPYLEDAEPGQAQYEAIDWALNGPYVLPMDVVKFATYIVNDDTWGSIGSHYFFFQD